MYRLILVLCILLTYSPLVFAQQSNDEQRDRILRQLREERELDRGAREFIQKRLKALYHPPLHLGIDLGLGLTSTNVPSDRQTFPKPGFQANIVGTYFMKDWFALYFSAGWNKINGIFEHESGVAGSADFSLSYFTFQLAPSFHYKSGFFYFGPVLGFKISDSYSVRSGTPELYEPKSFNFGIAVGGGIKVDFLYKIRMLISLEFRYFLSKWNEAPSSKWRNFGMYLKAGILYGIGSYKPSND
jgi:hypothetical protein